MLIDDMLAYGAVQLPTLEMYFDVTSAFEALPDTKHWQDWVRRLLDTTPARPPFDHTWWEFVDRSQGQSVRNGIALGCGEFETVARALARVSPPQFLDDHNRGMDALRAAGAVTLLVGTVITGVGRNFAPVLRVFIPLDDQDMVLRGDGVPYLMQGQSLNPVWANEYDPQSDMVNIGWQTAYFVALTHVRNIGMQDHEPDPKMQAARIRRGRPPFVAFKTLVIVPLGNRGGGGEAGATKGTTPIHVVRGNFAHYTDDAPLFGRYTGTYWRPAHLRGKQEVGVVVKDYRVARPAASMEAVV